MNLVAWAGLPLALRDLVRTGVMLTTNQLMTHPGLSGFITPGPDNTTLFLAGLLSLVDLYLIWQIILLVIGARAASEISTGKALSGIVLSILLILVLRAGLATGVGFLGSLTITRPFYF